MRYFPNRATFSFATFIVLISTDFTNTPFCTELIRILSNTSLEASYGEKHVFHEPQSSRSSPAHPSHHVCDQHSLCARPIAADIATTRHPNWPATAKLPLHNTRDAAYQPGRSALSFSKHFNAAQCAADR